MRYGARTFEAMATLLPPLLLTGGPAAGKTVTARFLAETTPRTGYLDVDDIRQLVKNGGAAPWDGTEGKAQQVLGSGTPPRSPGTSRAQDSTSRSRT